MISRSLFFAFVVLGFAVPVPPAAAQVAVVSGTVEERAAAPGERYEGTIRVKNTTGQPQRARVYAMDYRFFADGRTLYEPAGTAPRSNAAWIAFAPAELTLAPHEEATVRYTVSVPADAGLRGTYWSVLMVEGARQEAAATARGVSISPTIRYAVQVATHLGADAERRVAFQGTRLSTAGSGRRALEVDVANTGERADRLELRVELFDESGAPAGTFTATRGLVYPGTSVHQRWELGALPAGTYRALVVADTGGDDVFGAEYTLRI